MMHKITQCFKCKTTLQILYKVRYFTIEDVAKHNSDNNIHRDGVVKINEQN